MRGLRYAPTIGVLVAAGCGGVSTHNASQGASPTLGTPSYAHRQNLGRGFGAVAPQEVNANGDPGSVMHDVHWIGWGRAQAIGRGKAYAPGPHGGWTSRLQAAEIRVTDLGRCASHGPVVYRRLWVLVTHEARFPGEPRWPWAEWPSGQPMC